MDNSGGFIYIIQMEGHPYFKIGRTSNVTRRVAQISPLLPTRHKLLRYYNVKDSVTGEKTLHDEFKAQGLNGEWFNLTNQDLAYIHSMCLLGQSVKLYQRLIATLKTEDPRGSIDTIGKAALALSHCVRRINRRYDANNRLAKLRERSQLSDAVLDAEYVG
jgi:hypothetical protein